MKLILVIFIILSINLQTISQPPYNTATGPYALNSITTGGANTATGYLSSGGLTSGWNNTSHGSHCLLQNVIGYSNSAFGTESQYWNYNGNENVSLGFKALFTNFSGGQNTAFGVDASRYTSSNYGTSIGFRALYNTNYGNTNLGIGGSAGMSNFAGQNNSYIGYATGDSSISPYNPAKINTTIIGAFTRTNPNDTSNKITIGTNIGSIGGSVNWTVWSDKRIKESIRENVPGLLFINALNPVTYKIDMAAYKNYFRNSNDISDSTSAKTNQANFEAADIQYGKILHSGFIAQDVFSSASNIGYQFSGVFKPENENGLYSLSYEQFVIPLVKATQELNTNNDFFQSKLESLKKKYQQLCDHIVTMKMKLNM